MNLRTATPSMVLLLATGCGDGAPPATPPLPVTVAAVGGSGSVDEARYAGSIQADASVDVAFRVSGVVDDVVRVRGADGRMRTLQDGDLVRRGQMLARLRQDEYEDQVSDADAALRQAQADFERTSQLYENRSLSKADYDAAYARFTATRARLNQAQLSLRDATLRSPIDGVILRRTVEVGSLAGPSAPAFTVADTRNVKVVFGVPDVTISSLRLGGRLAIVAEAIPGATLQGRITRISPSADPNSRVFEVEAALPNADGRLKVGMLATLRLDDSAGAVGIFIPLAAIVRPAGDTSGYAVYVVRDSGGSAAAALRRISLGEVSGNQIAVREGLEAGERVIVRGATLVADGQSIHVMP
jgi:membrane fusion protein, multidrug efflux system